MFCILFPGWFALIISLTLSDASKEVTLKLTECRQYNFPFDRDYPCFQSSNWKSIDGSYKLEFDANGKGNANNMEPETIENFNVLLQPFSGCLIKISTEADSPFHVPASIYPILLTEIETWVPASSEVEPIDEKFSKFLPRPFLEYRSPNVKIINGTCSTSKLHLIDSEYFQKETCVSVHFQAFAMSSKPWACEALIDVYPSLIKLDEPFYRFGNYFRSKFFASWTRWEFFTSSCHCFFHFLIPDRRQSSAERLKLWAMDTPGNSAHYMGYRERFTIQTLFLVKVSNSGLQKDANIEAIVPFQLPKIFYENMTQCGSFSATKFSEILDVIHLQSEINLIQQQNRCLSDPVTTSLAKNLQEKISEYILPSELPNYLQNLPRTWPFLRCRFCNTLDDILYLEYARLWHYVMGNFTPGNLDHVIPLQAIFVTVEIRESVQFQVTALQKLTAFDLPSHQINFVSCGRPDASNFEFLALFSMYDGWTWGFCSLLSLVFPGFSILSEMMSVSKPKNSKYIGLKIMLCSMLRGFYMIYAMFLEKCDDFLEKFAKDPGQKFVVGSIWLGFIVLSNGYRNDNMYTLICNLQKLPYTHLDQLMEKFFEVFVKGKLMEFESFCPKLEASPIMNCPKSRSSNHEILTGNQSLIHDYTDKLYYPELLDFSYFFHVLSLFGLEEKHNSEYSYKIPGLDKYMNMSKLLPLPGKSLLNIAQAIKMKQNVVDALNFEQDKTALDILFKCNQTTFITSQLQALELATELKRNDYPDVFVGTEPILRQGVGVGFRGLLSSKTFFVRLGGAHASGIWKWWSQLVQNHFTKTSRGARFQPRDKLLDGWRRESSNITREWANIGLKRPKMSGNILVIFTVWGAGNLVAIFVSVVEARMMLVNIMLRLINVALAQARIVNGSIRRYLGHIMPHLDTVKPF